MEEKMEEVEDGNGRDATRRDETRRDARWLATGWMDGYRLERRNREWCRFVAVGERVEPSVTEDGRMLTNFDEPTADETTTV
ncbi:hypothetical protein HZH66_002734 [Vespula vulgaris]|uniref:Uncharacterized protein n=1 Tax=Vespula vulgaris TaxID=7454 RepID=A0A834NG89_VESVU|nr:hypothetical protein HZH66_002734 [Vespula vulgaris]